MAKVELDCRGMKCPLPTLKINNLYLKKEFAPGDTLVVLADCPTFEADVRQWCAKMKKVLVVMRSDPNDVKRAEIRL